MKTHIESLLIALLTGLFGFIIFFASGSISGIGEIGVIATSVTYLYISASLVRKNTYSWWYIGAVINLPIWSFMIFVADEGQFLIYIWGLITMLLCSYAGTFIGLWLLKKRIIIHKLVKIFLIVAPLILIVIVALIMNSPKAIPNDKISFVGLWKSNLRFELQIMPDGKAVISQNENDRSSEYENLNIKVAPSHITDLQVDFHGDSILALRRPGYYARKYRIDKYPYQDSSHYKMVLNGVILMKK